MLDRVAFNGFHGLMGGTEDPLMMGHHIALDFSKFSCFGAMVVMPFDALVDALIECAALIAFDGAVPIKM